MKIKSAVLVVLCAALIASVSVGCSQNEETQNETSKPTQSETVQTESATKPNSKAATQYATEEESETGTETISETEAETTAEQTLTSTRVSFDDFSIELPSDWIYEQNGDMIYFYQKQIHEETSYGMLMYITKASEYQEGWDYLYENSGVYLGEHGGYHFLKHAPTSPDVDTSNTELLNLWESAAKQVDSVLATIEWIN